jgi:hypothetical protein
MAGMMGQAGGDAPAMPDKVYAIGIMRGTADYRTPITASEESGEGFAPLSVLDADGERALPVFTTQEKAERGILRFMSEEERTTNPVGAALVDFGLLLEAMGDPPEGAPKIDYIGLDIGEGGQYALLRL